MNQTTVPAPATAAKTAKAAQQNNTSKGNLL